MHKIPLTCCINEIIHRFALNITVVLQMEVGHPGQPGKIAQQLVEVELLVEKDVVIIQVLLHLDNLV